MLKVLQQVLSEVDRMLSTMLTFSNQLETPPQVYEMTLEGSIIGRICLVEKEFTLIRQLTKHNLKKSQPMLGLDTLTANPGMYRMPETFLMILSGTSPGKQP